MDRWTKYKNRKKIIADTLNLSYPHAVKPYFMLER